MTKRNSSEELFNAVVRLSGEQQRAYLDAHCEDADVRAEVDKLLEFDRIKGGGLTENYEGMPSGEGHDCTSQNENQLVGNTRPTQLGDFEILRELGRGGMGVVYEAKQKSLNRRVALKVLSTGLGLTTKAIMRFKREAEAAAKLHHTNIVPIYSTGDEGRIPYYAMELVDGPSLDQVIRQLRRGSYDSSQGSFDSTDVASLEQGDSVPDWVKGTIGLENPNLDVEGATSTKSSDSSSSFGTGIAYFDNVASMMAGVADALAHAHDQGVIHRDIKPSNLLLSQDGRLSVNDFGLARMLEQPGMTISGELMGSPMYMSPEQIAVGRIPLDHRTDIYSLGASLYELLTLQTRMALNRRKSFCCRGISGVDVEGPLMLCLWGTQFSKTGKEALLYVGFLSATDCPGATQQPTLFRCADF